MKNKILPFFLVLALAGCGAVANPFAGEASAVPCPEAGFAVGAETAAFFPGVDEKEEPAPSDVAVYALLRNLSGGCTATENGTEVELNIDLVAQKTEKGQGFGKQPLSYFIAVLDQDERILQRERFYGTLDFGKDESALSMLEHRVKIPSSSPAPDSKIVVGFVLTPQQAAFNKAYPRDLDKIPPPVR